MHCFLLDYTILQEDKFFRLAFAFFKELPFFAELFFPKKRNNHPVQWSNSLVNISKKVNDSAMW